VIASVAFRNFKALRDAQVNLGPFNLVLGPNGSGKTSLIEALMHLRTLSQLAPVDASTLPVASAVGPDLSFGFSPPFDGIHVRLGCVDDVACDALHVSPPGVAAWEQLREEISRIRSYVFDHRLMSDTALREASNVLRGDGANLAAVIDFMQSSAPAAFAQLSAEIVRLFPEFSRLELQRRPDNHVALALALAGGVGLVDGQNLSQGMLQTIAVLTLSFSPEQPSVICIEEIDRGIHPRMLREIRDALYRLSYPESAGLIRPPVQVIATTHSPYLLDLFRDHPEEVIITQKHGSAAQFEKLSDRNDMPALLEEGSLGDLWFSGILGGVPEEGTDFR
jgi:predicted ATPase